MMIKEPVSALAVFATYLVQLPASVKYLDVWDWFLAKVYKSILFHIVFICFLFAIRAIVNFCTNLYMGTYGIKLKSLNQTYK